MADTTLLINSFLIIVAAAIGWYDRRRIANKRHDVEPIVLRLTITIDPTMRKNPTISSYQERDRDDNSDNVG